MLKSYVTTKTTCFARSLVCLALLFPFSCVNVVSSQEPSSIPVPIPVPTPQPQSATDTRPSFFEAIESHFDRLIHYSTDRYGRTRSGLWISSIDVRTNELPSEPNNKGDRYVPGSTLLYDMPTLLAAHELGKRTGCKCYPESADAYIRSYVHFARSGKNNAPWVDDYFDVTRERFVRLRLPATLRRHGTPAWQVLASCDAVAAQEMLDAVVGKGSHPNATLLEKIVAFESACWGLRSSPDVSVTNIESLKSALKSIRVDSLDASAFMIFLKSLVRTDGSQELCPVELQQETSFRLAKAIEKVTEAPFQHKEALFDLVEARFHNDRASWISLAPHDHKLHSAIKRLASHLSNHQIELRTAIDFARVIRTMKCCSKIFDDPRLSEQAESFGKLAIEELYVADSGMFRSRVGASRCDAIDGPGLLFLALLQLDGNDATEQSTLGF